MSDDIKEARALDRVDALDRHYEAHKSLQRRYENVIDRLAELNREIGRLTALNDNLRAKLRELVAEWKHRQMEDERTWKNLPPSRRDLWSGRAAATAECIDGLEAVLKEGRDD